MPLPDSDTQQEPAQLQESVQKLSLSDAPDLAESGESDDGSDAESFEDYDLPEILQNELMASEYTCLICTGEIGPSSKVWSCKVCWRVYDLNCIADWSSRALKKSQGPQSSWKCPSCNSPYTEAIKEYTCWCGKVHNPPYDGLMPHSCGQTCGVKLSSCVHGCSNVCHPGPHSDCTALGPLMKCNCGKNRMQWPCIITPYATGWQCKEQCQEVLPCGDHRCKKQCHGGLCGPCPEQVESTCFCGKKSNVLVDCSQRLNGTLSEVGDQKWIGYFSCGDVCDELLDCGVHKCENKCHSRSEGDHSCPRTPRAGETCFCGKSTVESLLGSMRENCEAPIPSCEQQCSRTLPCGHNCMSLCHEGSCPPCIRISPVKCACHSQMYDVPCAFVTQGNKPRCTKRCTAMMNCRRHRCTEVCCAYEPIALERERQRKKRLRNASGISDLEVTERVHKCQATCNKTLNCGKHDCQLTCHAGPCRPCMESSPYDYHCPCGRTTLQAPIRCGSMLPKCPHPCTIQPPCGHAPVRHECHDPQETACPKCPVPMEKECRCGKNVIKGVQCHQQNVSCGRQCNLPLPCGHKCVKVCHSPSEPCTENCIAECGKPLNCGHTHKAKCHEGECDAVCTETVTLKCDCGNLTKSIKCPGGPVESLKCDESCAIAERNRKLAEALGIDQKGHDEAKIHDYNENLIDLYCTDKDFGDMIESQFIDFMRSPAKALKFPPMKSVKRMFIHMLAEEYKFNSYSQDAEPRRNVVVLKAVSSEVPTGRLRVAAKKTPKLN